MSARPFAFLAFGLLTLVPASLSGTPAPARSGVASAPATGGAPAPAPPNGAYVYELSRNGGTVGSTTVVVYRRDDVREIETDESGAAASARAEILASYQLNDLGLASYTGTYQAPFLRSSPLGRAAAGRPDAGFYGQTTVRYRVRPGAVAASVDGTPVTEIFGVPPAARGAVRNPWIFDAPFMTGALLLPALRHRTNEALLVPVSEAFPTGVGAVTQRLVRATPGSPKTPKTDLAVDVPGVARIWFDPRTYIVHEVHFFGVNFDARLVSYMKGGATAPFVSATAPPSQAPLPVETTTLTSADGTTLHASLARPAHAPAPAPAVVLIAPGPGAGRDYDGDGPAPMFPTLAAALVARGYAVLRYDMRGIGKSGGSAASETWEQGVDDARAALTMLGQDDTLDPKRLYALGYGNGADLALAAASATGVPSAGVVALAPTVLRYRDCPAALPVAAANTAWRKSALAHDPSALAARAHVPLLVLHPGLPVCGETSAQLEAFDESLRATNRFATIVAARDLTQRFGSRYEAEAPLDTQEFFPYRFDASTADAIADWLDNPKVVIPATSGIPAGGPAKPPPAPPGVDEEGAGLPNPHASATGRRTAAPGTAAPGAEPAPGVVLPSGQTPPPFVAPPPTATPVPTPRPAPTATAATSAVPQAPTAVPQTPGAVPAAPPSPPPGGTAAPTPAASGS